MSTFSASLSTLPPEIILEILQHTLHSSYPSLARVCKSLQALVLPQLYRSVYYINSKDSLFKGNHNYENSRSQILQLNSFASTIRKSPSLSAQIRQASFDWVVDPSFTYNERIIPNITGMLPSSLEQLHISSLQLIPKSLQNKILVTSLVINTDLVRCVAYQHGNVDQDELFKIFSYPRLSHLSMKWTTDGSRMSNSFIDIQQGCTSNVTSLTFFSGVPHDDDLAEILSWPKKLKSLQVLARCKGHPPSYSGGWKDVHTFTFAQASHSQARYLEELYLSGACITFGDPVDLSSFTALRHLDLCQGDRMFYRQPGGPSSVILLPPALEVLRIDFLYRRAWIGNLKIANNPKEEPICVWLLDIAQNSLRNLNLKKVILDNVYGDDNRRSSHMDLVAKVLLEDFKQSRIELFLTNSATDEEY